MRQTLLHRLSTGLTALIVTVQIFFYPMVTFAQEASSDVSSTDNEQSQSAEATPAPASQTTGPNEPTGATSPTGVQQPTGSDAKTYVKNPDTGLWENDYYTWDPATGQTKPKQAPDYSYNPSTGKWDTTEWYYSPETGKYLPNTISTDQNPRASTKTSSSPVNTITNTGPNSNNQIQNSGSTTGTFDLFFDAKISNKIGQLAQSGSATVQGNTHGGDALSGDAATIANVLNMIQSSWGGLGSEDIATFIANIDGDVTGDLYVDPNALASTNGSTNIKVNSTSNAAIDNDIDVVAASGNATVHGNTTGGNATSGNASAVVNLLNLINSAIKSNKSFVGVLNINGNLDGDILLPPEMLQSIIAATGPNSNNQIHNGNTVNANLSDTNHTTINNTVTTDVGSGNANVSGNTTGGNAKSGSANSNVVLLNLTGKKVVAKNAMLVFVNVLGSWVGLIMDAPAGTSAVAITGPNSNNTINNDSSLTVDVDHTSTNLIHNDVNVSAHSGDATVSDNTKGGDATSGDASAGVNVLNMVDSEFDIDDWFGVLFINVFGKWRGSFGINTEAGNQPVGKGGAISSMSSMSTASSPHADQPNGAAQVFSFVPHSNSGNNREATQGVVAGATDEPTPPPTLSSSDATPAPVSSNSNSANRGGSNMLLMAGAITLFGVLMLGGERMVSLIRLRLLA